MTSEETDFQLQGEFAGFIRTASGKKRMVLNVRGDAILLKVQRDLRRELSGRLERGTGVKVSGVTRTELFTGETKRVVTQVRPTGAAAGAQTCTIKVCAHKTCWKHGGKELYRALESEIAAQDLGEVVRLKAVGCLDECKRGPNLECQGKLHRHCSAQQAPAFLEALVSKSETPQ